MRVRLLVLFAMALVSVGSAVTDAASAPTITKDATIPFGQTSVTIAWDTGDGSQGQVWFEFNGTGERLFAQGPSGSQVANFIGNSGPYVFRLYKGAFSSSPKAQGVNALIQTQQFKSAPGGGAAAEIYAVHANPDGSPPIAMSAGGGFTSGPGGQVLGSASSPPGFETNVPISATSGYPRRVYFAWDAGMLASGAPRPAANVNVSPPPGGFNGPYQLFTQGPYGIVAFDYVVDGPYSLTLTDTATGLGLAQNGFNTRAGVVTDKTTYAGGAAATVQFGFDSNSGQAAVVCVSNAAVGGIFANNGTIAALNNAGGGHGTVTGLPASATPYTLTVYQVFFGSMPNGFISAITDTGQNCGTGTPGSASFVAPKVGNGTTGGGPPILISPATTTVTIGP